MPAWQSPARQANRAANVENNRRSEENFLADARDSRLKDLAGSIRGDGKGKRRAQAADFIENNPIAKEIGDQVQNIERFPYVPTAAAVLGMGGAAAAAQAYSDQANEYLPTNPLAVAGRAVSNVGGAIGRMGGFGSDPFAEARNNLKTAGEQLGSARVIEALAMDQVEAMEVIDEGMSQLHPEIAARVDETAAKLMQMPVESSDGTVRPYSPEKAYTDAIKIVEAEIRAGG